MNFHPEIKSTRIEPEKPKCYLAGPFFTPEQLQFIRLVENEIIDADFDLFSPRLGDHAKIMNEQKLYQDEELRHKVYTENAINIQDSDLMLAIIDDRDTGTVWEMGFATATNVDIFSTTNKGFGMNLMLAHCIIGHSKAIEELAEGLNLLQSFYGSHDQSAMRIFKGKFMNQVSLTEGPSEHHKSQSRAEMEDESK